MADLCRAEIRQRVAIKRVRVMPSPERETFIPSLIALDQWVMFGERDFPALTDAAKQVLLQLKLRREHGSGLRGQVIGFDRMRGAHAASLGEEP